MNNLIGYNRFQLIKSSPHTYTLIIHKLQNDSNITHTDMSHGQSSQISILTFILQKIIEIIIQYIGRRGGVVEHYKKLLYLF